MRLSIVTLLVILSLSVTAQNPDSLKKERYLEIGTGIFTVGDIVWANDDFEKYKPSYTSFFQRKKEANSKALPLLITYKKQIKQPSCLKAEHYLCHFSVSSASAV